VGRHRKKSGPRRKEQRKDRLKPRPAPLAGPVEPVDAAVTSREGLLELPVASIADLAVQWWRLARWAAGVDEARLVPRHVARRFSRFLEEHGIEVVDLTGKPYEAGLAVEVLESFSDPCAPDGSEMVEETISPIVLWKGSVILHGQVVMRRGLRE